MKKPDFLIIGAARCGTSSLHKSLVNHPKISGPNIGGNKKEVHFFDKHYKRGLDWYYNLFRGKDYNFEATPNYIFDARCPKRIYDALPDIKLIVMLRNPVDRAYSHYRNWKVKCQWKKEDIRNPEHIVIQKGIYIEQLMRWFQHYKKEQFMIIRSEDYYGNSRAIIKETLQFLNMPMAEINPIYYDPVNEKQKKPNQQNQIMPTDLRTWMRHFYKPYNELLYQFIDRSMGWK